MAWIQGFSLPCLYLPKHYGIDGVTHVFICLFVLNISQIQSLLNNFAL